MPDKEIPPFPPPKKSGCLLRLAFIGACLLAGLAAAGTVCLESGMARRFIQKRINDIIPGTLTWEKTVISLLAGQVKIYGLTLSHGPETVMTKIPLLEADLSLKQLVKGELYVSAISVDQPRLSLLVSEKGEVDLLKALVPETSENENSNDIPLKFAMGRIRVHKAAVTLKAPGIDLDIPCLDLAITDVDLKTLTAWGKTSVKAGQLHYGSTDIWLESLNAQGRFDQDRLTDLVLEATLPGIDVKARGSLSKLFDNPVLDLSASLDVQALETAKALGLPQDLVQGKAGINLSVKGRLDNPDAAIRLGCRKCRIKTTAVTDIHISAALKDRKITVDPFGFDPGSGPVTITGKVDLSKTFPQGFTNRPAGPETILYDLTARQDSLSLASLGLPENFPAGSLSARVTVTGQGVVPGRISAQARADIKAGDLTHPQLTGPAALHLQGQADLKGTVLSILRLDLEGPGFSGQGSGHLDLSSLNPDAMTLGGSLVLDLQNLALLSERLGQPVSGTGQARLDVEGALSSPSFSLDLRAAGLSVYGIQVDELSCLAAADNTGVHLKGLEARQNQGTVTAQGTLDTARNLDALIQFDTIQPKDMALDVNARGIFNGKIKVSGPLDRPELTAGIDGTRLAVFDIAIGDLNAGLNFKDSRLTIEQAGIGQHKAKATITGTVNLKDHTLDIRVLAPEFDMTQLEGVPESGLAAGKAAFELTASGSLSEPRVSGWIKTDHVGLSGYPDIFVNMDASFQAQGPFNDPAKACAQVNLKKVFLVQQDKPLIRINDAQVRLSDGNILLPPVPVKILDQGSLTLSANGDINNNLTARASGAIPVAMLSPLSSKISSASGDIKVSLSAEGSFLSPRLQGSLDFTDLTLGLAVLEDPLEHITGHILFTPRSVEIKEITASLGQGQIKLSGQSALVQGQPDQFTLSILARQVSMDIPDTMTLTLNSSLDLTGTLEHSALSGKIDILNGLYYKDVDLSLISLAAGQIKKVRPEPVRKGPDFLKTIDLNIYVTRQEAIQVDNNLASLTISPNLTIRGTAYSPGIDGRAVVDDGTITFKKAEFEVSEGTIDFINPYKIEPEITLEGKTVISSWTITLSVSGTPDNLDVSFSSDPEESDADILSLIAFGKTTQEMGTDQGDGQTLPAGAIAEMLADPLGKKIKQTTGLSEVDISMAENDNGNTGVTVSLGADLSRQMSVSYGMEISDGETVQQVTTHYKLLENLILSSFQNTSGEFGGELKYRLEFR